MPLEFRCEHCQALLRVPDEMAGARVRCSQCQQVMTAPGAAGATPPNPFSDQPAPAKPQQEINPYASPEAPAKTLPGVHGAAHPDRALVAGKVQPPAIGMMVYAILAIGVVLLNLAVTFMVGIDQATFGPPPETDAERIGQMIGVFLGAAVAGGLMIAILYGAWKMLRLESYAWAMTASILSLLPCSICCPVGLLFGIWGIIILNDIDVKLYFQTSPR